MAFVILMFVPIFNLPRPHSQIGLTLLPKLTFRSFHKDMVAFRMNNGSVMTGDENCLEDCHNTRVHKICLALAVEWPPSNPRLRKCN